MPEHCGQGFTCCRWLCRSDTCTVPGAVTPCRCAPALPGELSGNGILSELWDLGLSRCAELPPPLEGVELRGILCFHGNGRAGSLSVIGCAGSRAVAGLHPSGDPAPCPGSSPGCITQLPASSGHAMGCPWPACSQEEQLESAGEAALLSVGSGPAQLLDEVSWRDNLHIPSSLSFFLGRKM